MCRYVYAFNRVEEDGEVFFEFCNPDLSFIVTSVAPGSPEATDSKKAAAYAHDALITGLQGLISLREAIPDVDDPHLRQSDGFVSLGVVESAKLKLYELMLTNDCSISQLARKLRKTRPIAQRLLDFSHPSKIDEIEKAVATFGMRLVHDWNTERAA